MEQVDWRRLISGEESGEELMRWLLKDKVMFATSGDAVMDAVRGMGDEGSEYKAAAMQGRSDVMTIFVECYLDDDGGRMSNFCHLELGATPDTRLEVMCL